MKMISSAKMHRAEADLRRLLPFRQQIETIIGNLMSADADFSSPLTEQRDVKSVEQPAEVREEEVNGESDHLEFGKR